MNISKIQKSIDLWNLSDLTQVQVNDYKEIYKTKSKIYGDVILKVSSNKEELQSEYNALISMSGKYCCKVYDYNKKYGLLLLEKIIPGNRLREENDVLTRIHHFLNLFMNIHKAEISNVFNITYLDWLKNAYDFCINSNINISLTLNIKIAYAICLELYNKYEDRVLLHGDLHHDNILINSIGEYCIIDPKGVVGPKIFDLPRFILNEMDTSSYDICINHIDFVIQTISKKLNYSKTDITKLLFMEVILANVWNLEDNGNIDNQQIKIVDELIKRIN